MIPTLRILTLKSKLKFGKYANLTIQKMFDLRRKRELISAYYKISSINYNAEILKQLNITQEWIISKPGIDKEIYIKFLNAKGYKRRDTTSSNKLKKESGPLSKGKLMGINHGRK